MAEDWEVIAAPRNPTLDSSVEEPNTSENNGLSTLPTSNHFILTQSGTGIRCAMSVGPYKLHVGWCKQRTQNSVTGAAFAIAALACAIDSYQ